MDAADHPSVVADAVDVAQAAAAAVDLALVGSGRRGARKQANPKRKAAAAFASSPEDAEHASSPSPLPVSPVVPAGQKDGNRTCHSFFYYYFLMD